MGTRIAKDINAFILQHIYTLNCEMETSVFIGYVKSFHSHLTFVLWFALLRVFFPYQSFNMSTKTNLFVDTIFLFSLRLLLAFSTSTLNVNNCDVSRFYTCPSFRVFFFILCHSYFIYVNMYLKLLDCFKVEMRSHVRICNKCC